MIWWKRENKDVDNCQNEKKYSTNWSRQKKNIVTYKEEIERWFGIKLSEKMKYGSERKSIANNNKKKF